MLFFRHVNIDAAGHSRPHVVIQTYYSAPPQGARHLTIQVSCALHTAVV